MEFEKIFASPAEACFSRVSKIWDVKVLNNMLEDWVIHFKIQSKTYPSERIWKNALPFLVIPESVVQLIFLISEKLEQPSEVRYITVELFDRFMMRHFTMLHESVYKKPTDKPSSRLWEKVVSRVQNQTLLRLMSCMQLASKLIAHYQVLSPKKVRQFLTEAGHSFTTSSIMSSEIRVYKTLDFKLPLSSPLVYVETLLAFLLKDYDGWNNKENENTLEPLYGISLQVLDIAYILHQELYCHLFWMATGKKGPIGEQRNQFLCVECDNLLLAAGVISCAASFHCPQESDLAERVLFHLAYTTGIPKKDIAEFAFILSQISLGHDLS